MPTTEGTQEAQPSRGGEKQRTSQLKEKLWQHLEGARHRLAEVRDKIANLREDDKQGLEQLKKECHDRIASQKQREQELRDSASAYLARQETIEEIRGWRDQHDVEKLDHRADRAEEYAVNAVVIAMMEADEVEVAVIDALDARNDADEARTST